MEPLDCSCAEAIEQQPNASETLRSVRLIEFIDANLPVCQRTDYWKRPNRRDRVTRNWGKPRNWQSPHLPSGPNDQASQYSWAKRIEAKPARQDDRGGNVGKEPAGAIEETRRFLAYMASAYFEPGSLLKESAFFDG